MTFENDSIKAEFFIKEAPVSEVDFKLTNKLSVPIKILWDDASLATNGYTYKVAHKNTKLTNKDMSMPPTSVAGKQYLKDVLVPSEQVKLEYHRRTGTYEWIIKAFLPERKKKAKAFDNGSLVLLLPMTINEKTIYPTFQFRINLLK